MNPLDEKIVAVSIATAPDMGKLGYPAREVDRVLFTICTALIRAGARILYGGNLDPDGYTFKIFRHLAKSYAVRRETAPFIHLVPEPVWRMSPVDDLRRALVEARGINEVRIVSAGKVSGTLFPIGDRIGLRPSDGPMRQFDTETFQKWQAERPTAFSPQEFSAMRAISAQISDARVIMGGRMGILDLASDRYSGDYPGVAEEALLTLRAKKPLVALGAFGGAARDVAIELGLLSQEDRVERGKQADTYHKSMALIREMRAAIADAPLAELKTLASLDHAEELAFRVVKFLNASLAPRSA